MCVFVCVCGECTLAELRGQLLGVGCLFLPWVLRKELVIRLAWQVLLPAEPFPQPTSLDMFVLCFPFVKIRNDDSKILVGLLQKSSFPKFICSIDISKVIETSLTM